MLRFFWEARKFATKFIWIGLTPPLFNPPKLPKNRNKIFWVGNDPPPPPRKFSKNMVQIVTPNQTTNVLFLPVGGVRPKRTISAFPTIF